MNRAVTHGVVHPVSRTRVLVSGFEPFGGSRLNPSQQIVESLANEPLLASSACEVLPLILPVRMQTAGQMLVSAVEREHPDGVICLGQASRRPAISIEKVFINLRDYEIADNGGAIVRDEPIDPAGAAAYFSTLPVRDVQQAITAAGVPAEISLSAGAYLCNEIGYRLMQFLERSAPEIPAGFIHVPMLPEQAAARANAEGATFPSMSLETSRRGVVAALACVNCFIASSRERVAPGEVIGFAETQSSSVSAH